MNIPVILAVIELITLNTIDGRQVQINPKQVTKLQSGLSAGDPGKLVVDEIHCIIHFTDGSFSSVVENCDTVRALMERVK